MGSWNPICRKELNLFLPFLSNGVDGWGHPSFLSNWKGDDVEPQVPPKQWRGMILPFERKDGGVKSRPSARFKTFLFKWGGQARLTPSSFQTGHGQGYPSFILKGVGGWGYPSFWTGQTSEVTIPSFWTGWTCKATLPFKQGGCQGYPSFLWNGSDGRCYRYHCFWTGLMGEVTLPSF